MKTIVVGLVALMLAIAGFAADPPATPQINPPRNGEEWLKLSSAEKLYWSIGYVQGSAAALDKVDVPSASTTPCVTQFELMTAGKVGGLELVSGLERFYSEPVNSVIPVGTAIRIYLLQTMIQEMIDTARAPEIQAPEPPAQ